MDKKITTERLFKLLSVYKLRDVAASDEVQFTRTYLYSVKNGDIAMSDELRNRLCRFLVARSIDAMREIYGESSASLIEACVDVSEEAKNE